jgi:hypothetical protein
MNDDVHVTQRRRHSSDKLSVTPLASSTLNTIMGSTRQETGHVTNTERMNDVNCLTGIIDIVEGRVSVTHLSLLSTYLFVVTMATIECDRCLPFVFGPTIVEHFVTR